MDFFDKMSPIIFRMSGHDEETTDTEDDSGIAEEPEITSLKNFPDLHINDSLNVQGNALNNFFSYW